jgi:transposase
VIKDLILGKNSLIRRFQMNNSQATNRKGNTEGARLYMSFELANKEWKLFFSDGSKERFKLISAGDLGGLEEEIRRVKDRFGMEEETKVISCYEAGRDGVWLHRYLSEKGIENFVVDPSSIEVDRRKKRAKTDRIDGKKLLRLLLRYCWGENKAWSVVRVPSVEEEDERHLHRELETLKKERTMHRNRIRSFLKLHGVSDVEPMRGDFGGYVERVRLWDGSGLPLEVKERLKREHGRLVVVQNQIQELERKRKELLKEGRERHIEQMMRLRGIGVESAWKWEKEFFGWRKFCNRREVGALAGLTPTPYDSGESRREQGINKAGNRRVRAMAIEIAWIWIRYQPGSKLTRWFNKRYAHGGKRMRRIGIVAVARRLLIDLWRFLEHGVIPEGAIVG